MAEDALAFDEVDVSYLVRGTPRTVLRGLSFRIGRGETYGLVGESGCGKSTAAFAAVRYLPRNGAVTAITFEYTRLEDGRVVGTGERLTLACDQVFKAIGQKLDDARDLPALVLKDGRISVDRERRTSLAGVWAGGDCVAGGSDLTVVAVEDGKQAALSIDRALKTR